MKSLTKTSLILFTTLLLNACVSSQASSSPTPLSNKEHSDSSASSAPTLSSALSSFRSIDAQAVLATIDQTNQKESFALPATAYSFAYSYTTPRENEDWEIRIVEGSYLYWKNNATDTGIVDTNVQYCYTDPSGQGIVAYDLGSDKHYSQPNSTTFASLLGEATTNAKTELLNHIHKIDQDLLQIIEGLSSGSYVASSVSYGVTADHSTFASSGAGALQGKIDATMNKTGEGDTTLKGDFRYSGNLPVSLNLSIAPSATPAQVTTITLTSDYSKATPIYPDLSEYSLLALGGMF